MASSISPGDIPTPTVDQEALFAAWHQLQAKATALRNSATGTRATWHGLAASYKAPESGELMGVLDLPVQSIDRVAGQLDHVASALWTFAVEGGSAAKILKMAHADAQVLKGKTDDDHKWDHDDDLVDENTRIRGSVAMAVTQFMAAERHCANSIQSLIGGPQLHAVDKSHPHGYGPSSISADGHLPWGDPVKLNTDAQIGTPMWLTQQETKFVKGIAVAAWGTIKGLFTLAQLGLSNDSRQAWLGVATLLGGFGHEKQAKADLALVKGLVASDDWSTDPAKALGETFFNLGTLVVPGGAVTKLGRLGELGDLSKLGKVGDAGTVGKTITTLADLRNSGNLGKLRIVAGKIHIGDDIVIGKDGSAIIGKGLPNGGLMHDHVPPSDAASHPPSHGTTAPHAPATAHPPLPDKDAVSNASHLKNDDPIVLKHNQQVERATHPQLQTAADDAWKSANDHTSQRWLDYKAAHGGKDPSAAVRGTWAHTDFRNTLEAQARKILPHDSGYRIRSEVSFRPNGTETTYAAKGSIRPDVIIERQVTSATGRTRWQVVQVWDLKTGNASLASKWVKDVAKAFGIDRSSVDLLRPT